MKLHAEQRNITGKKVKNLRKEGVVPGTVYGPKRPSQNIQLDKKAFISAFKEAGFSNFIQLEIGEQKPVRVLVKNYEKHPLTNQVLDVSFYQVDEESKVTVNVPISYVGEAPAVKLNLGFLVTAVNDIALHCLPKDLPSSIEIDISSLQDVGDSITISSIKLAEGVEFDASVDVNAALTYIAAAQKVEEEKAPEVAVDAEGNPIETPAAEGESAAATEEKKAE
jgi:large subunit ribosomal protein L25